jgi:hypothetical protein
MVVPTNESNIASDEDVTSESDIALNNTAGTKLDAISKLDYLIRRPEGNTPRNAYHPISPSKATLDCEIQRGSDSICDSPQGENKYRSARSRVGNMLNCCHIQPEAMNCASKIWEAFGLFICNGVCSPDRIAYAIESKPFVERFLS